MDLEGMREKAKEALNSEQGEQRSDQAIDKAEQFADDKTGGKFDKQIEGVGDMADRHLGQEDDGQSGA